MAKRLYTVILGLPLLIALVSLGGLWLRFGLLVLSLMGLYEFYRALSTKVLPVHFSGYLFSIIYFLFLIDSGGQKYILALLSAFMLTTLAFTVIFYKNIGFHDTLITISGFFYVPFLLSFIYFVRDSSVYFVWLIFVSASISDTCAYIVGRKFGRIKLAGTPSPGKTVEGCIGGVVGAALAGLFYGHAVIHLVGVDNLGRISNQLAVMPEATSTIIFNTMSISIAGAVFSQFGDLFASAIKRSVKLKDFGKVLPGHGGVLDRFDGILVAAPMVYMVMIFI